MRISEIISCLESFAPPVLQESYDNAGLIAGQSNWECSGILIALDITETVVREAIEKKCNLIISHHPVIFGGIKKITGQTGVEKTLIEAIKKEIALYALHTNLDNMFHGVNGRIADKLELRDRRVLDPKSSLLEKLVVFVPLSYTEILRNAIFEAGAGHIGNYSECSFSTEGAGTFKPGDGTQPFAGEQGKRHIEKENRLEVVYPGYLRKGILDAMGGAHPYEEVAYDVFALTNPHGGIGSGMIGELGQPMEEGLFLSRIKELFGVPVVRHTRLNQRPVRKVAVCGGAGSFLIPKALGAGADFYITADIKYHEFFAAEDKMVLADIGHFESEQFTIDLIGDILREKFPTFAILKTTGSTNPVHYFL